MATGNDSTVRYAYRTTDGAFFATPFRGRIRGIFITPSTSNGSVELRETDIGGDVLCRFDTAGGNRAISGPMFPGYGIAFRHNVTWTRPRLPL